MKRTKDRATRIITLILAGMMCLGLAACGTVTEADSSAVDTAKVVDVEEEEVGATSLTVYFVLDEVTDEMTAYKINGGYYYISTEQAAAIAEGLGEDFSFADADGNVITITSDGSYSSDTGKALVKVVGVGDIFANAEDMSLTVAVTEVVEEEIEEEAEEETEEETEEEETEEATTTKATEATTSASKDTTSKSSGDSTSATSKNTTTTATTTAETEEEETECEHNWKKLLDREDKTKVVLCGCGEYFIVDDYGSYNAAVDAWCDHVFGDDCWGSYCTAYIYGTYYRCSKCRATKECSDTELNLVDYTGTRSSSSYVLAKDQS